MKKFKSSMSWWLLFIFLAAIASQIFNPKDNEELKFSTVLQKIDAEEVESLEFKGGKLYGKLKNGDSFYSNYLSYPEMVKDLKNAGIEFAVVPLTNTVSQLFVGFLSYLPFLIIGMIIYNIMKNMSGGGGVGGPFKFAKSKAKLLVIKGKITFNDVAGIDDARDELKEIVDFLQDPEKYTSIGAKIPRGCLLVGEPGTGKTLLARAIAGEAGVPFFFISGSDFVEMFVGVGASRVRDMFEEAKRHAPCLVFIDEIDAIGKNRGGNLSGANDEREQTLNQLLVEMDGFEGNEGIIVIAATNREDVLDKALLRPGRFDRQIAIQLPDIKGREEILAVHAKNVKMAPDVDLKSIARSTPGFTGAELANIINESALLAARNGKKIITNYEIEEAKERRIMGVRNQNRVMKEEEKKLTAYHEAGHAVIAFYCENSDPIHKATIIGRGNAGGYVARVPEYDKKYTSKAEMFENIVIAMGGRVAEEMIFGKDKITGGASSDIKSATYYAKHMVSTYGMSDKVGPLYYLDNLVGGANGMTPMPESCSNETLKLIDDEIKNVVDSAEKKAREILTKHSKELEIIAKALLEYETLTGEEIKDLIEGKFIREEKEELLESSQSLYSKAFSEEEEGK